MHKEISCDPGITHTHLPATSQTSVTPYTNPTLENNDRVQQAALAPRGHFYA